MRVGAEEMTKSTEKQWNLRELILSVIKRSGCHLDESSVTYHYL